MEISSPMFWIGIGLFGQCLFFGRFFVQWIASEKQGKSVIPISFWYLSILGSLTLFCYACYRHDPVFIIGQTAGIFIYARNLWFIFRERNPQLSD